MTGVAGHTFTGGWMGWVDELSTTTRGVTSATTRGVAWAMCRSHDARPVIFALAGSIAYKRTPEDGWQGHYYDTGDAADKELVSSVQKLESEGAIMVAGPVDFEFGFDESAESVGAVAERALRVIGAGVII